MKKRANDAQQVHIRRALTTDAVSLREAVKAVAAEKRYLATVDGFSLGQTRAFLKHILEGSLPQVLAVVDDEVVGFCDILPTAAPGFTHVGRLGMGVRCAWRRQGIGRRMFGFGQEGLKVRGRKLEDQYQDIKLMALWL